MDKENVVFEHIVPRAVKQMWMNTINKQDKDKSRDKQQRAVVKPVLSQEYGDAFISKDLISDGQNNAADTNLERNDNVSESSELTGARNKWGIILKHVERKEELESQNEKSLPYGFPRLRSLSGSSKKYFDENQSSSNLLTASKRSQSVELLLENDNKDSIIDIEKINRSFTEQDYESVRILGNSFETSHKNSTSTKSKNRVNSLSKSDSNILKNQEKVKANLQNGGVQAEGWSRDSFQKHRTLAELLKNDQLNLNVDVLDEPVQPVKTRSQGNVTHVTPHKLTASSNVESSKSITSPTHPPENIKSPRSPTTYFFTHGHSSSSPSKQDTFSYNLIPENKAKESVSGEKPYATREENEKTKLVIEKDIEPNDTSELEENITSVDIVQTSIKSTKSKYDDKNYLKTINNTEATTGRKISVDKIQAKSPQVNEEVTKSSAVVNRFDKTVDNEVSINSTEPKVKPAQNDTVAVDSPLKNDRPAPRVVKVIKTDKKTDKESLSAQNTTPSKKPKIVGKVLASPLRSQGAIAKEDKKKNVYVFQMDKKQEALEEKTFPTNKPSVKLNKLGQVILDVDGNDMEMTRSSENTTIKETSIKIDQENRSSQGEIKKIDKSMSKPGTEKKLVREVTNSNESEALPTQNTEKVITTSLNQKKLTETKEINEAINQEKLQKKTQQNQKEPTVLEASFQLKSEEPTSPPKIKTMENSMNKQRTKKTSLDVAVPFSKPGVEKYVKSERKESVGQKQKRSVGRLIIMSGEERDRDLKEKATRKKSGNTTSENVRQVQLKVEPVNSKKKDGFSLTFMSNELGELEDDPNEPPPVVPTIVFNEPVVPLKSMMLKNGNKNRKVR